MDAAAALAELAELSAQVEAAAVLRDGAVEATVGNAGLADRVARAADGLLAAAEAVRPGGPEIERIEIVLPDGGVFVVRAGARTVVAATVPEPTAGLVLYDLRTCLRRIVDKPAPKRRRKKADTDA
jgi:predicted regulator of Ras-like GTPase activity (Roadblock/LC7/MglB family)